MSSVRIHLTNRQAKKLQAVFDEMQDGQAVMGQAYQDGVIFTVLSVEQAAAVRQTMGCVLPPCKTLVERDKLLENIT